MLSRRMAALTLCLFLVFAAAPLAIGQSKSQIAWQDGPCIGKIGDLAQISIPSGYRFSGREGAQRVLELTQNPVDGDEVGVVIPSTKSDQDFWYAIFEFARVGYVKDSDKDNLDGDAILKSIQKATEESNKTRESRGWPALHIEGWSRAPFYDVVTNNLTWAVTGYSTEKTGRQEVINYSVRILGREGTMNVDLVMSPDQSSKAIPDFEALLQGFSFLSGERYADFRPGDRVAKYGLTGLILGGAIVAAAKTGLLAKFWKLLVVAAAGAIAGLKKFLRAIKRLLMGKAAEEQQESAK